MPALLLYIRNALWLLALGATAQAEQAEPHGDYLVTIPAEGGEPRTLIIEPRRACGSPRWSPDGEWIAYDTIPLLRDGVDPRFVRVVRADGRDARTVGDGGMPTWSPDGRDLVWHTYGQRRVVVARRDGSGREVIASDWFNPVWLKRDPRRVVTLYRGVFSLGDLRTGHAKRVLAAPERVVQGYSVSPQGDRVSYRNGLKQLCVADLERGAAEKVLLEEGTAGYSSWSPEGDRLVVSWSPLVGGRQQLYVITLSDPSSKPEAIPGQGTDAANLNPDWSPDGATIVYRRGHQAPRP